VRGDPPERQAARGLGAAEGARAWWRVCGGNGVARGARGDRREGRTLAKLGDVRYVYTRAGARIFKVVSFYLLRYSRGRLGDLAPEQRIEVAEVTWLPLAEAESLLAYRGEREMAGRARALLEDDAL
jgi:hypothetical protein